jgi:OmpA-OmpF porin, OOP family
MQPILRFVAALSGSMVFATTVFAADAAVETVKVRAVAHFDFDRDGVRPEDQPMLLADVAKMQGVTWQTVTAVGHTDSIGAPRYNHRLSAKRARAVKAYLVGKGLDASMIKAEGMGEAGPLADNGSAEGRAQNRRTEVEFQGVRAVSK